MHGQNHIKNENGVRVSDLATQFGMTKSTICTILKNRETIKKADVARGMTVITKQRSQTIKREVKNLCTKYCCKSLNKQSSGVQERINPFTLIPMRKIVSVYERPSGTN